MHKIRGCFCAHYGLAVVISNHVDLQRQGFSLETELFDAHPHVLMCCLEIPYLNLKRRGEHLHSFHMADVAYMYLHTHCVLMSNAPLIACEGF